MITIYKYTIGFEGTQLYIPSDASIVHFEFQEGVPSVWVYLDTLKTVIPRAFEISGTGFPIPETSKYLKTTIEGSYVWHLCETVY